MVATISGDRFGADGAGADAEGVGAEGVPLPQAPSKVVSITSATPRHIRMAFDDGRPIAGYGCAGAFSVSTRGRRIRGSHYLEMMRRFCGILKRPVCVTLTT